MGLSLTETDLLIYLADDKLLKRYRIDDVNGTANVTLVGSQLSFVNLTAEHLLDSISGGWQLIAFDAISINNPPLPVLPGKGRVALLSRADNTFVFVDWTASTLLTSTAFTGVPLWGAKNAGSGTIVLGIADIANYQTTFKEFNVATGAEMAPLTATAPPFLVGLATDGTNLIVRAENWTKFIKKQ